MSIQTPTMLSLRLYPSRVSFPCHPKTPCSNQMQSKTNVAITSVPSSSIIFRETEVHHYYRRKPSLPLTITKPSPDHHCQIISTIAIGPSPTQPPSSSLRHMHHLPPPRAQACATTCSSGAPNTLARSCKPTKGLSPTEQDSVWVSPRGNTR